MIIDHKLKFTADGGDNYVGSTTPTACTKDIDLGDANPGDNDLTVVINVTTAFAGGTNVLFSLMDSADDSTYNAKISPAAVVTANLTAGAKIFIPVPPGIRRYLRLQRTEAGTYTAGKFDAQIVQGIDFNTPMPDAL